MLTQFVKKKMQDENTTSSVMERQEVTIPVSMAGLRRAQEQKGTKRHVCLDVDLLWICVIRNMDVTVISELTSLSYQ